MQDNKIEKPMSFEENRHIQLEILKDVAAFCEKNGLEYFLAYGTLIGAVRHKGFIPWDDDIDIQMPRDSYNRFIELYSRGFTEKKSFFRVVSPYDEISRHSIVKVIDSRTVKIEKGVLYKSGHLGIDIDIFPIDGMPANNIVYDIWYRLLFFIYSILHIQVLDWRSGSFKRRFWGRLVKFVPLKRRTLLEIAKRLHSLFPLESSMCAGSMEMPFNYKCDRMKKEWFSDYVYVDFEGVKFRCPREYHSVLKNLYGDYMKLPPAEEQVTHHTNDVYWKE